MNTIEQIKQAINNLNVRDAFKYGAELRSLISAKENQYYRSDERIEDVQEQQDKRLKAYNSKKKLEEFRLTWAKENIKVGAIVGLTGTKDSGIRVVTQIVGDAIVCQQVRNIKGSILNLSNVITTNSMKNIREVFVLDNGFYVKHQILMHK